MRVRAGREVLLILIVCCVCFTLLFLPLRQQTVTPGPAIYMRASGYNEEWVDDAYRRSPTAALKDVFLGSRPLFPPCNSSLPPGIPRWGHLGYIGPFQYLNASKNPCWYDDHRRLQCIPYFYVGGVNKCGTTDLFASIMKHPDVAETKKEVAWLTFFQFTGQRNLYNYTDVYQTLARDIQRDLDNVKKSKKIAGDGTPDVFQSINMLWGKLSGNEGCSEPRVLDASMLANLNPKVKIIFIFRNPVNRLYSQFLFDATWRRMPCYQRTPGNFHNYTEKAVRLLKNCARQKSLRHCVYNKDLAKQLLPLRLQESLYSVILEDWLRIVPREQMLFLRFEDYVKNRAETLSQVFQFLDLDPVTDTVLRNISRDGAKNKGQSYLFGPMLPETREMLQDFLHPFMVRLSMMLGDRFSWW